MPSIFEDKFTFMKAQVEAFLEAISAFPDAMAAGLAAMDRAVVSQEELEIARQADAQGNALGSWYAGIQSQVREIVAATSPAPDPEPAPQPDPDPGPSGGTGP